MLIRTSLLASIAASSLLLLASSASAQTTPAASASPGPVPMSGNVAFAASTSASGPQPLQLRLPYQDGAPVPVGYHVEEHTRRGLMIAGAISGGVGVTLGAVGVGIYTSCHDGSLDCLGPQMGSIALMTAGGAALVTGIVLFAVGSSSRYELVYGPGRDTAASPRGVFQPVLKVDARGPLLVF